MAHRKSVVLLRNDNNVLPLTDEKIKEVKLYVEMFPVRLGGENTQKLKETIRNYDKGITITDNLEEATHAFVWVKPKQDFLKRKPLLTIGPETGIQNVNRIIEIQKKVPTITAINMRSPWLINEIEPNAAAVIATFGVKTEALLDVIRGRFNPTGKLPFTIPASQKAVIKKLGMFQDFEKPLPMFIVPKAETLMDIILGLPIIQKEMNSHL